MGRTSCNPWAFRRWLMGRCSVRSLSMRSHRWREFPACRAVDSEHIARCDGSTCTPWERDTRFRAGTSSRRLVALGTFDRAGTWREWYRPLGWNQWGAFGRLQGNSNQFGASRLRMCPIAVVPSAVGNGTVRYSRAGRSTGNRSALAATGGAGAGDLEGVSSLVSLHCRRPAGEEHALWNGTRG